MLKFGRITSFHDDFTRRSGGSLFRAIVQQMQKHHFAHRSYACFLLLDNRTSLKQNIDVYFLDLAKNCRAKTASSKFCYAAKVF